MLSGIVGIEASPVDVLIRLGIGVMAILLESIQKPAFPTLLGTERFAKIGVPYPGMMRLFVGWNTQQETRADPTMLLSRLWLSVCGAGGWSFDRRTWLNSQVRPLW